MKLGDKVSFCQRYIRARNVIIDINNLTVEQAAEFKLSEEITLPRYEKKTRKPLIGMVVGKRKIEITRKLKAFWSGDPEDQDRGLTYPGTRREIYLVAVSIGSMYKVDCEDVTAHE